MLPILDRSLFKQLAPRSRWHHRLPTLAAIALAVPVSLGAIGFFVLAPGPSPHAVVAAAAISQAEPPHTAIADIAVPATTTLPAVVQPTPAAPQPLVINQAITEPARLPATDTVTRAEFESSIASLRADLLSAITSSLPRVYTFSGPAPTTPVSTATFAYSQKIDQLSGTSLSNITVSGVSGLTDADIPDGITASNYVPLTGGVLTASTTIPYTATFTGALQRSVYEKLDDILSVKDFGAKGDGSTDDTAAIQAAIDYAVANNRTVYFPRGSGNYQISSELTIAGNVARGFGLVGEGTIEQNTDNVPILHFNASDGESQYGMKISGLMLRYKNTQSASSTSAVCMLFSGSGTNSYYNSEFSNLGFWGCNTGMAQSLDTSLFWGNRVENLYFHGNIRGKAISFASVAGGQPNNYFGNIYALAISNEDTIFEFYGQNNLTLDNIEINRIDNSVLAFDIQTSVNVAARNIRIELGTFNTDYEGLFRISAVSGFQLNGYELKYITFNPTNYNYAFRDATPYATGIFSISGVVIRNVTGNNKFSFAYSTANIGRVQPSIQSGNTGYLGDIGPFTGIASKIILGYSTLSPWGQDSGNIYSSVNVGIGTTSPSSRLSVWGANTTSGVRAFEVISSASTTGFAVDNAGNGYLRGNLGIGTTTPSAQLEISAGTSVGLYDRLRVITGSSSANRTLDFDRTLTSGGWSIQSRTTSNSAAQPLFLNPAGGALVIGTTSSSLVPTTPLLTVWNQAAGSIANSFVVSGDTNVVSNRTLVINGNRINSYTTNVSVSGASLLLQDLGGNVGIATTSPWRTLSAVGTVGFDGLTGSTGAGSLCLSANREVVYNSASDACLPSLRETKHDISSLSVDALEMVDALDPVSFVYNEGDGRVRYGFIAEDTSAVDPHLVTYSASGTLSGIDDRSIISVVVKAIQELSDRIASFALSFTTADLHYTRATGDEMTVRKLCIGSTCVDEAQLQALLANAGSTGGGSNSLAPSEVEEDAPDTEAPVIAINGNNPAHLQVGDTYNDLGAMVTDNVDLNLGYQTFVGSTLFDQAQIDTSEPNEWHIHYVATDNAGNTATSTRTVIVEAPSIVPSDAPVEEPEGEVTEELGPEEEPIAS